MEQNKRTVHMQKVIDAMAKVEENLIAFKKKMDSPLVVMQDGKIVHIKPWLEEAETAKK